jgi:hypothetical protein
VTEHQPDPGDAREDRRRERSSTGHSGGQHTTARVPARAAPRCPGARGSGRLARDFQFRVSFSFHPDGRHALFDGRSDR